MYLPGGSGGDTKRRIVPLDPHLLTLDKQPGALRQIDLDRDGLPILLRERAGRDQTRKQARRQNQVAPHGNTSSGGSLRNLASASVFLPQISPWLGGMAYQDPESVCAPRSHRRNWLQFDRIWPAAVSSPERVSVSPTRGAVQNGVTGFPSQRQREGRRRFRDPCPGGRVQSADWGRFSPWEGCHDSDVLRGVDGGGQFRRISRGFRGRRAWMDGTRSSSGTMSRPARGARSSGASKRSTRGRPSPTTSPPTTSAETSGRTIPATSASSASRPRTSRTSPWRPTSSAARSTTTRTSTRSGAS